MMQITEITPTLAELAVSLAGFSAVIVALRPQPIASWSAFDRFNFRMLLQVAALTIFFSIFPFGTLTLLDDPLAWQAAALAYGFVHLADLASFVLNMPPAARRLNRIATRIGFVIAIAQIALAFLGTTSAIQTMYLATLVWHLGISCLGFVSLVYFAEDADGDT